MQQNTPPEPTTPPTSPIPSQPPLATLNPLPPPPTIRKPFFTFSRIILILVLLAVIGFGSAYIYTYAVLNAQIDKLTHSNKQLTANVVSVSPTKISPTATPIIKQQAIYNSQESNGFPAYLGAVFIGKKNSTTCTQMSGYKDCGGEDYIWETVEDFDKVNTFYKTDPTKSGWVCSGGGGDYASSQDASATTICKKANLTYEMVILTISGKTTITLKILPSPTP